ncbi:hypothetical protein ACHAWF_007056 [Thalassiosira exigua]
MAPRRISGAVSAAAVAAEAMLAASLPSPATPFAPAAPPSLLLPRTTTSPSDAARGLAPLFAIRRGGRGGRGGRKQPEFVPPMNDEIKQRELRVNVAAKDGKDESLGIMSKDAALAKARELGGLDLILINPNSDPPVCKIVDYSKYRYAQEKKRKEKAKNSKATEVKEVKMSYKIGDHDYDVRLRSAIKFIKQGNRVKATVIFRGREVQHDQLGVELLERLASDLDEVCVMEGRPKREGRNLGAILTPRAEVVKAVNDAKRSKEKEKKQKKAEALEQRNEIAEARKAEAEAAIGGVLDDLNLGNDDDDEFEDDDIDDASLDELLGSSKVADDLFA